MKWKIHLLASIPILLGGIVFYLAFENDLLKGAALAGGSILIDVGIIYIQKSIREKKEGK